MNDTEFLKQVKLACLRFHAKYGFPPEKIGIPYVRDTRGLPFEGLTINISQQPVPDKFTLDTKVSFNREFVRFEPFVGIGQNDFRLYSEKTGTVSPADLIGVKVNGYNTLVNNL